uniref:Uncharacterized protein n=1 Tax=Timema douglasi TaxID=61478 RepID=A0A7R8VJN6_TIMDO|nr:unnamed protein product [Timema douglasi]
MIGHRITAPVLMLLNLGFPFHSNGRMNGTLLEVYEQSSTLIVPISSPMSVSWSSFSRFGNGETVWGSSSPSSPISSLESLGTSGLGCERPGASTSSIGSCSSTSIPSSAISASRVSAGSISSAMDWAAASYQFLRVPLSGSGLPQVSVWSSSRSTSSSETAPVSMCSEPKPIGVRLLLLLLGSPSPAAAVTPKPQPWELAERLKSVNELKKGCVLKKKYLFPLGWAARVSYMSTLVGITYLLPVSVSTPNKCQARLVQFHGVAKAWARIPAGYVNTFCSNLYKTKIIKEKDMADEKCKESNEMHEDPATYQEAASNQCAPIKGAFRRRSSHNHDSRPSDQTSCKAKTFVPAKQSLLSRSPSPVFSTLFFRWTKSTSSERMCGDRMVVINEKQDAGIKRVAYLAPSWARICEVWDLIDRRDMLSTPVARYCNDLINTLIVDVCDTLT